MMGMLSDSCLLTRVEVKERIRDKHLADTGGSVAEMKVKK